MFSPPTASIIRGHVVLVLWTEEIDEQRSCLPTVSVTAQRKNADTGLGLGKTAIASYDL